jgi:hypothetical protein
VIAPPGLAIGCYPIATNRANCDASARERATSSIAVTTRGGFGGCREPGGGDSLIRRDRFAVVCILLALLYVDNDPAPRAGIQVFGIGCVG